MNILDHFNGVRKMNLHRKVACRKYGYCFRHIAGIEMKIDPGVAVPGFSKVSLFYVKKSRNVLLSAAVPVL